MANDWTYTQNFNSLNDGDLNAQDSWVANSAFDVQTSVVAEGAKAVSCISGGGYDAERAFTGITTSGTMHISMRATSNALNAPLIRLKSSEGSSMCQVNIVSNNWSWFYSSANHSISAFSADTWYDVIIDFDFPTYKYRVSVDNGTTFTTWQAFITAGRTDISSVYLVQPDGDGSESIFFDDIRTWNAAVGPTNLKSYNTNLKANIKTINTNPIANVKSLNTNT